MKTSVLILLATLTASAAFAQDNKTTDCTSGRLETSRGVFSYSIDGGLSLNSSTKLLSVDNLSAGGLIPDKNGDFAIPVVPREYRRELKKILKEVYADEVECEKTGEQCQQQQRAASLPEFIIGNHKQYAKEILRSINSEFKKVNANERDENFSACFKLTQKIVAEHISKAQRQEED